MIETTGVDVAEIWNTYGTWFAGFGTLVLAGVGVWGIRNEIDKRKTKLHIVAEVRNFIIDGKRARLPVLSVTNNSEFKVTITGAFLRSSKRRSNIAKTQFRLSDDINLNLAPLRNTDLKTIPFVLEKGEMGQVLICADDYDRWTRYIIGKYATKVSSVTFVHHLKPYVRTATDDEVSGIIRGELKIALRRDASILYKRTSP